MPTTDHRSAPADQEQQETTTPAMSPSAHELAARLAAVDAAMTVRLDLAGLAASVDAAHPETAVDLADVVRVPAALPDLPELAPLYSTPAAATLQRAARRLAAGGWCRGATVDTDGARCLYGVVHTEAPTARAEHDALAVLLDTARRRWPDARTIPEANDRMLRDAAGAEQLLNAAAQLADARGL